MAAATQLRFSPLPPNPAAGTHFCRHFPPTPPLMFKTSTPPLPLLRSQNPSLSHHILSGSGSGSNNNGSGSSGGGSGSTGGGGGEDEFQPSDDRSGGPLGMFLEGWRSRVAADPQFPFKVLMEELVGVTACVLGDMASRPNFGLSELDFVFSTLVVGSILNFVLMYLLAPTTSLTSSPTSLPSYIFEPGNFPVSARITTLLSKGATFAAVGFGAGLVGTAISNGLLAVRKKLDPEFETPNKAPPTLLNAATWAAHMGVSSNLRYQTLNGLEFAMGKVLPGPAFKALVVALRCANNVLGGMSFVILARMTGSQKSDGPKEEEKETKADTEEHSELSSESK
ncbi:uncharacterized protein M6B38_184675 [Iris pallida]|uniref:Uncharacterized protein n=1 Tax=Iris pallida TaxID=29817 RepID=A0AAX6EL38_IRIPA|nr:uncharacterized protein M6B38_184675 [Iris pallida]